MSARVDALGCGPGESSGNGRMGLTHALRVVHRWRMRLMYTGSAVLACSNRRRPSLMCVACGRAADNADGNTIKAGRRLLKKAGKGGAAPPLAAMVPTDLEDF